ncbi:hypothetical protein [Neomegalonema perideroedes]|uniref:hypothetical protein n=1 Tax=Neomegalonema perideroedes TaxID=217219 RepID=UPI0003A1BEFA|nr:hypothetical protein [Neomegalonema perideroedes]
MESFMLMSMASAFLSSAAPLALVAGLMGDGPERDAVLRFGAQSFAVSLRAATDFRYDEIAVGENKLAYLGATLGAPPALGRPGCEVAAARIEIGEAAAGRDQISIRATLSGIEVAAACLKPQEMAALAMLGPQALKIDRAEATLTYEIGPSLGRLSAEFDAAYGRVGLELLADRLHAAEWTPPSPALAPAPAPEPEPPTLEPPATGAERPSVKIPRAPDLESGWPEEDQDWSEFNSPETRLEGRLLRAELRANLAPRLAQTLSGLAGGPAGIEGAVRQGLESQLARGGELSPAESRLVDSAARELGRVAAQGGGLVVSLTPETPPSLSALVDLQDPKAAVEALRPVFAAAPPRLAALIDPAEFETALSAPESLPAARRLILAKALLAGEGVPPAPAAARGLLAPLAEAGDAEAALALAGLSLAQGDSAAAYAQALRAGAQGLSGAQALLDRAETGLNLAEAMRIQGEAPKLAEDPLLAQAQAGDLDAVARLARAAAEGVGRPRDYAEALTWAGVAAAAGDYGAASLHEGLRRRFSEDGGTNAEVWKSLSTRVEAEALKLWMGGLGARLRDGAAPAP